MEHEVRHKLLGRNEAANEYSASFPSPSYTQHRRRHLARGISGFKFAHKLWSLLLNTLSDINLLARIYPERISRFPEKSANVFARGKYATPRMSAEGEILINPQSIPYHFLGNCNLNKGTAGKF